MVDVPCNLSLVIRQLIAFLTANILLVIELLTFSIVLVQVGSLLMVDFVLHPLNLVVHFLALRFVRLQVLVQVLNLFVVTEVEPLLLSAEGARRLRSSLRRESLIAVV